MGSYIHAYVERRTNGRWFPAGLPGLVDPDNKHPAQVFNTQNYTMFGWLADVRNYAKVPPIAQRRGLPDDVSDEVAGLAENMNFYGHSWLSLRELLEFDYEATFEDRRAPGGHPEYRDTFPPGMGEVKPYREIFPTRYWEELEAMKQLGDVEDTRIVFWFD